jgi:predicted RNase H-like HicB family nuclease
MELSYTYYEYEGWYIGYINDYPDYQTQGQTLEELEEMLKSLYDDIKSDVIPYIRHSGKIKVAV